MIDWFHSLYVQKQDRAASASRIQIKETNKTRYKVQLTAKKRRCKKDCIRSSEQRINENLY